MNTKLVLKSYLVDHRKLLKVESTDPGTIVYTQVQTPTRFRRHIQENLKLPLFGDILT